MKEVVKLENEDIVEIEGNFYILDYKSTRTMYEGAEYNKRPFLKKWITKKQIEKAKTLK